MEEELDVEDLAKYIVGMPFAAEETAELKHLDLSTDFP